MTEGGGYVLNLTGQQLDWLIQQVNDEADGMRLVGLDPSPVVSELLEEFQRCQE